MKQVLLLPVFLISFVLNGQIIYDPTVVHDDAGEFYDVNNVFTIELNFYDSWYHDTLKYWKENYIEKALPAELSYGGVIYDSVAVKYKGNSTFSVAGIFNNPKLPYNIDLNDIISGQDIQGYKKIKLGNAWFDPTFSKEALASSIYKQYMPSYEVSLVRLMVNGDYLGLYINQEDVGYQFLKKHFGENNGPFFKCEPMPEEQAGHPVAMPTLQYLGNDTLNYYESYERKSPSGWDEFLNLMDVLNNDISNIEQVINVDRVLWNFAVTTVLSNEDTYNTTIIHNYYMYQTADGKFQMLPWDLTESFCGVLFTGGSPESHYELSPLYGLDPYFADRPLVYQLLGQDYYRKRYFAHIRTIMEEYYTVSALKAWILDLQQITSAWADADTHKPHNMTKFSENVDSPVNWWLVYSIAGVSDVVSHRKTYLDNHEDVIKVAPVIYEVTQNIQHPSADETVYISAHVSGATSVKLRVTNDPAKYASNFPAIMMLDNGLNGDATAGDNIFTAEVPYSTSNDHIKYYIEAEDDDAMALMPERAEYFYYHYYVDQVVGDEEMSELKVSVYPNPASHWVTVNVPSDKNYDLKIYDLNGKLVSQHSNLSGPQQIEVAEWSRGTYLLEISSGETTKTQKLILN